MEFLRKAKKLGNSAGVLLPKYLLGSEVKVTVVNKPINIKKEALKFLDEHLQDLRGIYITNENPIEILAVSSNIKKLIQDENLKLSIVPISIIKRDLNKAELKAKLIRAKTILNHSLLSDLKQKIRNPA